MGTTSRQKLRQGGWDEQLVAVGVKGGVDLTFGARREQTKRFMKQNDWSHRDCTMEAEGLIPNETAIKSQLDCGHRLYGADALGRLPPATALGHEHNR